MPRFGQRGGDGPTAGKKARLLVSPDGKYSKRVFFAQKWLVILPATQRHAALVVAYNTEEEARRQVARVGNDAFYVRGVEPVA